MLPDPVAVINLASSSDDEDEDELHIVKEIRVIDAHDYVVLDIFSEPEDIVRRKYQLKAKTYVVDGRVGQECQLSVSDFEKNSFLLI